MYRNLRLRTTGGRVDNIAIVLPGEATAVPAGYEQLDRDCSHALAEAMGRGEFSTEHGAIQVIYPARGPKRLIIAGLGDSTRPAGDALRAAGSAMLKAAYSAKITSLSVQIAGGVKDLDIKAVDAGRAFGEGLAIANFSFDQFRKKDPRAGKPIDLRVSTDPTVKRGFERALTVGESVNMARTLAATPPNVANPSYLVKHCRSMAKQVGLRCSVIDTKRAAALGMGGLLAVGAGGSTPPALIALEWRPTGKAATAKPIMLVGKAITFDTGGYSIKPSASMPGMKYDKCGGMAVIGAMHAIAKLKLKQRVVGLIPTAENMVDTKAYRPSDIITFSNGVTCEVTNTDAEGRLVLADALAYGCKTYKPKAVIDLATLTGGVVVALGSYCAGCFCGDTNLRGRLFDAADATGERLWHLPLWEEHKELIKSTHADIVNSGIREAHAIQGAVFLSYFVDEEVPWAHLDIAGVADVKSDGALYAKGPTGYGVRLVTRAIEQWK